MTCAKSNSKKPTQKQGSASELYCERSEQVLTDPESIRLVQIFRDAEQLKNDIEAFRRDHPTGCKCLTCWYLAENHSSHPDISDYLIALHAIIASSSAAHEDLPGNPRPPFVPTGKEATK
jgi:hypothetical protein